MRTDRELLELAAKAAGLEISLAKGGGCWRNDGSKIWPRWNPLEDEGDALRLAVSLWMNLEITDSVVFACSRGNYSEPAKPDPNAAMRRAIVRAAAEIGAAM